MPILQEEDVWLIGGTYPLGCNACKTFPGLVCGSCSVSFAVAWGNTWPKIECAKICGVARHHLSELFAAAAGWSLGELPPAGDPNLGEPPGVGELRPLVSNLRLRMATSAWASRASAALQETSGRR